MVAITPGTSGTFQASTAEGRAIEILTFIQGQESATATNPEGRNYVTASIDLDDQIFSGTFSLPATQAISGDGSLTITATPYLVGAPIVPGGGSPTFKSSLPERYLLEVLMYLQGLERVASRNPQGRNAVLGTYNSDSGVYQGSFVIPVDYALVNGIIQVTAKPYLTDS